MAPNGRGRVKTPQPFDGRSLDQTQRVTRLTGFGADIVPLLDKGVQPRFCRAYRRFQESIFAFSHRLGQNRTFTDRNYYCCWNYVT